MAESTLGIGKACADCARALLGSATKIAKAATAPIHVFFISLSVNWDFRLDRARWIVLYLVAILKFAKKVGNGSVRIQCTHLPGRRTDNLNRGPQIHRAMIAAPTMSGQ